MSPKQICTTPLRLPQELKDWAKERAASQEHSLNAWIIALLTEEKRKAELQTSA